MLSSRVAAGREEAGATYRDCFAWREPAALAPSPRIPAIRRGENGGFLTLRVIVPEGKALGLLCNRLVKDPARVDKVQQRVQVTVLAVDLPRRRISFSMRRA